MYVKEICVETTELFFFQFFLFFFLFLSPSMQHLAALTSHSINHFGEKHLIGGENIELQLILCYESTVIVPTVYS